MQKLITLSGLLLATQLTACSVYMASTGNGGVDPVSLMQCKTRTCILAKKADLVSQQKNAQGQLISEVYYAKNPTRSSSRAVMHGVLDVATLGLWEAAGTPIEGVANSSNTYTIKVFYKADQE